MTSDEATHTLECKNCSCISKIRAWKLKDKEIVFVKPPVYYCPVCGYPERKATK